MLDLHNGIISIEKDLYIRPKYTFAEFKKSSFFRNQDGIRIIYLEGQQCIDNKKYMVSLFFRDEKIYMVSLICCEREYSETNEKKRKELHDEILKQYGIEVKKEYPWGIISSDYDNRSNCSSINIMYN